MNKIRQEKKGASRKTRIRSKFPKEGYRLVVFRSNRYLFAQIIDSKSGKTLIGLAEKKALTEKEGESKTKTEKAKLFGLKFAKEALSKKAKIVVFDRGPYRYHGRIEAFAEGAREGGLQF